MKHASYPKTAAEGLHLEQNQLCAGSTAAKLSLRRFRNVQSAIGSRRRKSEQLERVQQLVVELQAQLAYVATAHDAVAAENAMLQKQNDCLRQHMVEHVGVAVTAELCRPTFTNPVL